MVARKCVSAGPPWEDIVGYSRAVKIGNRIVVSGTTSVDDKGNIVGKGDAYTQMVFAIKKIQAALNELDASLDDVIRTRIYVTDITRWKEIARAHHEFFGAVKPASTMVQVARLIEPDVLVEVEVEAAKES